MSPRPRLSPRRILGAAVVLAALGACASPAAARHHPHPPAAARHHPHPVSVSVAHWVTDTIVAGADSTQDVAAGASVPICVQKPTFAVGVSYAVQGHPTLRTRISISWTGPGGLQASFKHHVGDLVRGPLAINVRAENRTAEEGLLPGTYQANLISAGAVVSTSALTLVAAPSC